MNYPSQANPLKPHYFKRDGSWWRIATAWGIPHRMMGTPWNGVWLPLAYD